jgi:hypothetical protein
MIRKLITLALILSLLVSVLAGTLLIQNGAITFGAQGQPSNSNTIVNGSQVANITVQSPENMTYKANNVTLAFTIECDVLPRENVSLNRDSAFNGNIFFFTYGVVLDYNPSNLLELILNYATNGETVHETPDNVSTSFSSLGNNLYAGDTTLTDLTQGAHNVTIWVSVYNWIISDFLGTPYPSYEGAVLSTVSFTISPTPTQTPAVPEFPSLLIIVPLLLSVFSVAVIVRHRKTANLSK